MLVIYRGRIYEFFRGGGGGSGQEFFKGGGGGRILEKASPWEFSYTDEQKNSGGHTHRSRIPGSAPAIPLYTCRNNDPTHATKYTEIPLLLSVRSNLW